MKTKRCLLSLALAITMIAGATACDSAGSPSPDTPYIHFELPSKSMIKGETFVISYTSGHLDEDITWDSSNKDAVTVDGATVTAVGEGTATVTAAASGVTASCVITVSAQPTAYDYLDFLLEIESGRDIRILQLTDTQIIDAWQKRTPDRLEQSADIALSPDMMRANCFDYIDQAVARTNPDLILMTGDNIYGEFDDNGTVLKALVAAMEKHKIPWAPVFGNHDNESAKGVDWQCEQFINATYCLFKRGEITGNGNYNIGLRQGGELVRVIYMLDSNGCSNIPVHNAGKVHTEAEFGNDQILWVRSRMSNIQRLSGKTIPSLVGFHIPMTQFIEAKNQYTASAKFTIGETFAARNGDFGTQDEAIMGTISSPGMYANFTSYGTDGVFAGHYHLIGTSILYNGIRLTFGLKTGVYDKSPPKRGGVYIKVAEGGASFTCEQVIYDPAYQ